MYQSVKEINQKWGFKQASGLWKKERTHYSNALSPCVYVCTVVFCINVRLLYCLFSSLIIDVSVRQPNFGNNSNNNWI